MLRIVNVGLKAFALYIFIIFSGCSSMPIEEQFEKLLNEQNPSKQEKLAISLAKEGEKALPYLISKMQDGNQEIRFTAADVLVLMAEYRPEAVKELLYAIEDINLDAVSRNYPFYIRLGQEGTVELLLKALKSDFTEKMCVDYLNCGHSGLEKEASAIARENGYDVRQSFGTHKGPKWGSGN
jgi:hypothetical protein